MNPQPLFTQFPLPTGGRAPTISKVVFYTDLAIFTHKNSNTKTIVTQIKFDNRGCINSYKTSTSLKLLSKRVTTVLKT